MKWTERYGETLLQGPTYRAYVRTITIYYWFPKEYHAQCEDLVAMQRLLKHQLHYIAEEFSPDELQRIHEQLDQWEEHFYNGQRQGHFPRLATLTVYHLPLIVAYQKAARRLSEEIDRDAAQIESGVYDEIPAAQHRPQPNRLLRIFRLRKWSKPRNIRLTLAQKSYDTIFRLITVKKKTE